VEAWNLELYQWGGATGRRGGRVAPPRRGDWPAGRPRLRGQQAVAPPRRGAGSRLWPRGAATPAGQQGGRGDAASKQGRRRAGAPDRGYEGGDRAT